MVPLPKRTDSRPIGESRPQAVRRFLSLERSLNCRGKFRDFESVMQEYLDLGHAEVVPSEDMDKPPAGVLLAYACCLQEFQHHHED